MSEHKATLEQWAELRARVEALEAAQQQEQDPDGNREDQFRCALLWVLWHHQGGSSPIGQPLRRFLGLGPHDRMNPAWVQLAQRWGEDYASSSALPETEAQAAPAGSLVERLRAYSWRRPLQCPSPATIAECGGPCEQAFHFCDCGLLEQLNPELKGPAPRRLAGGAGGSSP